MDLRSPRHACRGLARARARALALALAIAIAFVAIAPPARAQEAAVPALAPEIVLRAAEMAYGRDLERARKKRALNEDRRKVGAARRASLLLVAYAPTFEPKVAQWSWSVNVETRDDPIAYCLPGGKIMLSTGLFDRTRLAPEELAVVIAHVMAHAMAGHDTELALRRLAALPESADPNRRLLQLADIFGSVIQTAPHDRDVERETDAMALELMARAGVDPRPAPEAWRKIARAGGAAPPAFLALHATWTGRVEEIEKQLRQLLPIYEQAQAGIASRPRQPPVRTRPGLD